MATLISSPTKRKQICLSRMLILKRANDQYTALMNTIKLKIVYFQNMEKQLHQKQIYSTNVPEPLQGQSNDKGSRR